jgi:hypothetical protein
MSDKELSEALNNQFVMPPRMFLGQELAPYTEGSRILMSQIKENQDNSVYFVWAFIFLHIQLKKDRKSAVKLCWDKDAFRDSLIEYVSNKTESDRDLAIKIVSDALDDAKIAVLEPESQNRDATAGN